LLQKKREELIYVFGRVIGFAITLFIAALLIVSAVGLIQSVLTPLLIIAAIVIAAVIAYRIFRKKHWW